MSRIAYVNGQYVRHSEAAVHIEDRGYQFADGVYEVIAVEKGRLIDEAPHLDRLDRSLRELRIAEPMSRAALGLVLREVIRRNRVLNGIVYIQATRGVAPRDHPFPAKAETALVVTSRRSKPVNRKALEDGVKVITIPDIRWGRCDIKSVSLLPNILGKQQAREAGAFEAWQIDRDGFVTEGTSTNAWIVTKAGELITRNAGNAILSGITRMTLIELARESQLRLVERPFTLAEAKDAAEAFSSSTTAAVMPVVRIDDAVVGEGKPGPLGRRLRSLYSEYAAKPAA